ncbi:phosphoribosyltransferase [Planctomycetota bacterium]|nr:phosphoribosyltransferase [Planctomycetota bacterium]
MQYNNRTHAGIILADEIRRSGCHCESNAIVLGLPRGGVPVAYEVARELQLPLDVMIVRKLGAPLQPELAIGAIASDNITYLNKTVIKNLGLTHRTIENLIASETTELNHRRRIYVEDRPHPDLYQQNVILIDDGLATGSTMLAAIEAVKTTHPSKILIAIPVAPPDTIETIRSYADQVICPLQPNDFSAVGQFYKNFDQTSDEEVKKILQHVG